MSLVAGSFAFTHASNMSKQNPRISTHSHDADTSDVRRIPTLIGFRYIASRESFCSSSNVSTLGSKWMMQISAFRHSRCPAVSDAKFPSICVLAFTLYVISSSAKCASHLGFRQSSSQRVAPKFWALYINSLCGPMYLAIFKFMLWH